MKYLLDTNACIGYLNGRAVDVRQRLESLPSNDVFVCSVVKAELFYGAMKSPDRPCSNACPANCFSGTIHLAAF
jgi:predicted nucleic acid-binding protein